MAGSTVLPITGAAAADPDPDAQCSKLLADVKTECTERNNAQAELKSLGPPAVPPNLETEKRRKDLEGKIKKLEESPFLAWCGGWTDKDKPCSDLADLLQSEIDGLIRKTRPAPPPIPTSASTSAEHSDKPSDEQKAKAQYLAESDRRTATNAAGTTAQREAVEAVQPITLAGGAITLAGTRTGTQGVATITVNPFALARPDDPALRRLFDVSVTSPFALEDSGGDEARFVGVRVRANLTAYRSSATLRSTLEGFYQLAGQVADQLEERLRRAPNVRLCALNVIATQKVTAEACGSGIDLTQLTTARENSYAAIRDAQREADRYYFGLDLRTDFGDPTGDAVPGDNGTMLLGTFAAGYRIPLGKAWDLELRARSGGDYFHPRDTVNGFNPNPVVSFDWGAASILGGHVTASTEKQRMAFGVGLEGRHTEKAPSSDLAPTNFIKLNAMVIVPVVSGGDLGLSFSIPLMDSEIPQGTIIAASTDLGLLDGAGSK